MIKDSIGNTGSLDYIEFYSDGSWARMGCSTHSNDYVRRIRLGALAADRYGDPDRQIDRCITSNFSDIELEF
jgi:hypothetical protein